MRMVLVQSKIKLPMLVMFLAGCCLFSSVAEVAEASRFDSYEIRSIRRKYMSKTGRTEVGGQGSLIMNQPFIYTLLASGIIDYHFSELMALEVGASYGVSVDKDDKRILDDEFDIKTQILRTSYIINGGILWTPVYGKTQLPSGRLLYFDSFLHTSVGMTGVEYDYAQCIVPDSDSAGAQLEDATVQPAPATFSYMTFLIGLGQKFFLDKNTSFRWDVREHAFNYAIADGSCDPSYAQGDKLHHNITLQIGASTFF
jgi:outer membrane beta-barrel protein